MDQQKLPKKNPLNAYAKFSGIAIQMIVIIGLGSWGGVKLDEKYPNEYHIFTLICSLASVAIATYMVIRQVSNTSNK
ncbi:AtpZ/AtpI family protein [Spongiimicrobium sp. 3-5]|uniref:AtpZ/AtpI family protein n=1 Tax=Spongiimicrobium sp. 3-5 TaxID=3332596 RepID=UPI00397F4712